MLHRIVLFSGLEVLVVIVIIHWVVASLLGFFRSFGKVNRLPAGASPTVNDVIGGNRFKAIIGAFFFFFVY